LQHDGRRYTYLLPPGGRGVQLQVESDAETDGRTPAAAAAAGAAAGRPGDRNLFLCVEARARPPPPIGADGDFSASAAARHGAARRVAVQRQQYSTPHQHRSPQHVLLLVRRPIGRPGLPVEAAALITITITIRPPCARSPQLVRINTLREICL